MRPHVLLASAFVLASVAACSSSKSESTVSVPVVADGGEAGVTPEATLCAPAPPAVQASWSADCPVPKPSTPDTLDEALQAAGVDRCTLGYTAKDWSNYGDATAHDPYRLPFYDEVHDHAFRVPGFGRMLTGALDGAAQSPLPVTGALQVAAFATGSTEARCPEPFALDGAQPLARAVAQVIRDNGGSPDDAALEQDAADVPMDLQRALAQVVLAAGEAQAAWNALASGLTPGDLVALSKVHGIHLRTIGNGPDLTRTTVQSLLSKRFDLAALARGGVVLALRIERARLARFAGLRGFAFEQQTPIGRIVVSDADDQVHADGAHVLVSLDTGGNDTYRFPAGAVDGGPKGTSGGSHVGLAFDLAGRDLYAYDEKPDPKDGARLPSDGSARYTPSESVATDDGPVSLSETPRQGAARLGYGMLFDFGSDADHYRSLRFSQGYGAAGVGVLYDESGDDLYEGEAAVQGASHFGIGLLVDGHGSDTYRAYSQAQGFAGVRCVGMLYDGDGDDHYLVDNGDPADGGDPLYWSIQVPGKGNNSFSQGSAFGRRSPGSGDDVDMSGGLGILRDRAGNDEYVASVQAQASGYWFGTGILADGQGDDSYDARYYMQGSGAHFAMALFYEADGNDRYNQHLVPTATSIGVGHDYTVSWHLDLGGNDVYRAPVLSLGSGNANGIGIFINAGGDDVYRTESEPTLGASYFPKEWNDACPACAAVPTVGIFADVGGHDTYEVTSASSPAPSVTRGDGITWHDERSPSEFHAAEHGIGLDRDDGHVELP